MVDATEALERLKQGNERFVEGENTQGASISAEDRLALAEGQAPFAIILGCSDSRVPAELVFDQGFGDLFVIRIAGNVVTPSGIGSVEFAAEMFGSRLVVVLGHSRCGAIAATIDELQEKAHHDSRNLRSIVDRVKPALEALVSSQPDSDHALLVAEGVRANVRASVEALQQGSGVLERLIAQDGLVVVGAEYDLQTGEVTFLDEPGG